MCCKCYVEVIPTSLIIIIGSSYILSPAAPTAAQQGWDWPLHCRQNRSSLNDFHMATLMFSCVMQIPGLSFVTVLKMPVSPFQSISQIGSVLCHICRAFLQGLSLCLCLLHGLVVDSVWCLNEYPACRLCVGDVNSTLQWSLWDCCVHTHHRIWLFSTQCVCAVLWREK